MVASRALNQSAGCGNAGARCERRLRSFATVSIEKGKFMISKATVVSASRKWVGLFAFASLVAVSGQSWAQSEQQDLVNAAETTLSNFLRDPDMTWLQRHIGSAKAVLIAPQVVKAGWIFGGSGGRAALFARNDQTGRWEGPAFYNLATASVGFQAGIAVSETVTLILTERGFNSLLANSVKVGGDASIAAGPVGAGANADVTTDFVAFSRSKGVYGGLNLDGTVITLADNWNNAYYGRGVLPTDILVRATVHNPQADGIAGALSRAANVRTSQR
jgi:SH3 domain-containing YSC84-like protein 1